MTLAQLRGQVDQAWKDGRFKLAARLVLSFPVVDGRAAPAKFWIDWAHKVITGEVKPKKGPPPDIPLFRDGDLFGEPLTNGRPLKRR